MLVLWSRLELSFPRRICIPWRWFVIVASGAAPISLMPSSTWSGDVQSFELERDEDSVSSWRASARHSASSCAVSSGSGLCFLSTTSTHRTRKDKAWTCSFRSLSRTEQKHPNVHRHMSPSYCTTGAYPASQGLNIDAVRNTISRGIQILPRVS